jgi:hypothetical protein
MKTGKMAPQPDRDEPKSFTKETKVGRNATKVERIKKSDDEIGYQRSIKKRKMIIEIVEEILAQAD